MGIRETRAMDRIEMFVAHGSTLYTSVHILFVTSSDHESYLHTLEGAAHLGKVERKSTIVYHQSPKDRQQAAIKQMAQELQHTLRQHSTSHL